jgi:putative inorganic carbon (HCO3(-)) transporter
MQLEKLKNWYPTIVLITVLLLISLAVAYLLATKGIMVAPIVVIGLLGVFVAGIILYDYRVGFYLLFAFGVFMFYIDRIIASPIPQGVVYDALAALTFIALFVNGKDKRDWTFFKNPITITFAVITTYQLLQLFNPYAVSPIGWLVSMRNNTSFLLYVVCFQLFNTLKDVKRFTAVWVTLAMIVALYGIYQELAGLTDFEMRWMHSVPERIQLYIIWGKLRKFSMLSDPSAFGLFMAFTGLACLVLALGPFKAGYRLLFLGCAIASLVSMSYSGTRTAFAMVAVGVVFFILLTIRNRTTMIAAFATVFFTVIIIFGPFYGGTVNRIRSTFNPKEDPSMSVRDVKRIRLQEYVLKHPIGGGLYTTGQMGVRYSKGHELAGGWDPDSGYLLIALELGWIGLIIFQVFFFLVMLKGINNYFALNNPLLRTLTLMYLVPFLALSVAHFTQDAMFQKPINLIVVATYALVIKLPTFERKLHSVDLV